MDNLQPTTPEPNSDPLNITEERAARRFYQIASQEAHLAKLEKKILDAKDKLATLKEQHAAQVEAIRAAARDEGDLPLFADLD